MSTAYTRKMFHNTVNKNAKQCYMQKWCKNVLAVPGWAILGKVGVGRHKIQD